ncbi:MAG TPA: CRISPR-associated endonuclease Cas3'' [Thermoanaerobaculia bacterium]
MDGPGQAVYYAHSAPTREGWEPLRDHLRDVAERAACFAARLGAADEARFAGLLHDLGKYSSTFTLRLEGKESGLDHWSAGAWAAVRCRSLAAALVIQGHHIGLQSPDSLRDLREPERFEQHHPLGLKLTENDFPALLTRLAADGLSLAVPESSIFNFKNPKAAAMLDVRMLFSALVDADFLETEAHFQRRPDGGKAHRSAGPDLRAAEALALLDARLAKLAEESSAASPVRELRADLLRACREGGDLSQGIFTLSAPTGAGKTLAMLAFALRHAAVHGLSRIVVAVPFLSIIEQTVKVYRDLLCPVFGDFYVLEHHSLAGTRNGEGDGQSEADRAARRLAENWDAPLVVTTSVQLLESLFANRPSACRKLHRLAGSVILLDEVQTLPPRLAVPTLATLSHLADRYGSSVVFATATQPAFDHLDERVRSLAASGWAPEEIVDPSLDLFGRARRTQVVWQMDSPRPWPSLAEELAGSGTALCIVNLKRHAQTLCSLLRERDVPGLFHLSTNLCPAHRERILAEVRRRLDLKLPCLLISTQCVEAGVDLDFPLVFRAFGPLDAIAQAAGRCNRNGRLPQQGLVRVFLPEPEEERYPPGGYEQAASVTRMLLKARGPEGMDIQSTELFDLYYRTLYDLTRVAAAEGKAKKLLDAMQRLDFQETAELYRLIDQDAINVVVPYAPDAFATLVRELREAGRPTAAWVRRARPHTVNVYRPKDGDSLWGYLDPAVADRTKQKGQEWYVLLDDQLYDRDMLGLTAVPQVWIA